MPARPEKLYDSKNFPDVLGIPGTSVFRNTQAHEQRHEHVEWWLGSGFLGFHQG